MQEFRIVAVPYELGRLRDGVGCGAEALLAAGAAEALGSAGATIAVETVEIDERYAATGKGEIDAAFALIAEVSERVRRCHEGGAFPVILGGSCFLGVGALAGMDEPDPAVVWLDAHGDFNHPDTTTSGYFDGMGLSVMTGGAWQGMLATVPGAVPIAESRVVQAGARDFDPPEEVRLDASDVIRVTAEQLRTPEPLLAAVDSIGPVSGLYLHLDLDVLDAKAAGVNVYSAPGGIDGPELEAVAAAVVAGAPVRALSLTCYDPAYDRDGKLPPIALAVLEAVAREMARG